jgi:radical SAM superfamily enzyme YgiQ (UPF0313 family)
MKLLLIAPASGRWTSVGKSRLFGGKVFRFSMLSLLSVAAETPADVNIRIIDEQIEDIPWDAKVDLVGITCMTALAPRAYEIARRFRARGVPVVLGGMHPSLCPDEAIRHADAVLAGEAEDVWARMIEDARAGRMRGVYRANGLHSLHGLRQPPRHLLQGRRYATVHAVQATRGCPHGCDFCAISAFNKKTHRHRPVVEVIAEVSSIPDQFIIFVDDNLTADLGYARELFLALIPLRKWWITQSTLALADDPELVKLAAWAGCKGVFVGLETFSDRNLGAVSKSFNRVSGYREAVRLLHRHGIAVEAGVVFGFDGDTPEVFAATLKQLDDLEIDVIQASIFTPLPGTPRYEMMKDRIVDGDWSRYDFHHVVFRPRNMSASDLQAGHDWVTYQFYRPWRIVRRMWRHVFRSGGLASLPYLAAVNIAYYGRTFRWKIRGWDPARRTEPARAAATTAPAPAAV